MSKTSEFIYKEAQKYFIDNYNLENTTSCFSVSINVLNKILDFPVLCIYTINRIENEEDVDEDEINYYSMMTIYSKEMCEVEKQEYYKLFEYNKKLEKFTSEKINQFLLEFKKQILPNLQVDKLNGEFEIIDVINIKNLGIDIFSLDNCVSNECMVCLENTHTLTYCNHSLCIGCWNKLDNKSCPMCKTNLFIKK